MKQMNYSKPTPKTFILIAILAGTAITACNSSSNPSRTKDIATDLGQAGVTYYYKIDGESLVRTRCQQGQSTTSLCQEDSKRVPFSLFKTLLAQATESVEDSKREYLYSLLASGIVFRALSDNELLSELRPILAHLDTVFDRAEGMNLKFVSIPAGTFMMGSPDNEPGRGSYEGPQHQVTISKGFEMQTTEVTQSQWLSVMGSNPSNFQKPENCPGEFTTINSISMCPNNPVEQVSWNEAQEFISKLNAKADGYTYRLPTEAEWEYAARAGTTGQFAGDLDTMAWYHENSGGMSHPVGAKQANAWGLFDMHGNVWEWTGDWYGQYSATSVTDPVVGPSSGYERVDRGGSWGSTAQACRSASRNYDSPGIRSDGLLGFRLLRTSP